MARTLDLLAATPGASTSGPIHPRHELGAYEALWTRPGSSFKKLAAQFRRHPGSLPSDFVSPRDAQSHGRSAVDALKRRGIASFDIRLRVSPDYPRGLHGVENPVELIYFQGDWSIATTRCVALVGTRHPSAQGAKRAHDLGRLLVEGGFTVVSGLAQGIDAIGHRAALEGGGLTIAVAGTPLTHSYPAQNADLQRRIAARCLLITQVPILRYSRQTARENRLFFPERNITMAALTEASVIVEAGERSGALIEARHALQQGRKLFIPDGCFHDASLTWPQKLLERGAIRVSSPGDILEHLGP